MENVAAAAVALSPREMKALDGALPPGVAVGPRYGERLMALVDR
jgi:hypothetical protein